MTKRKRRDRTEAEVRAIFERRYDEGSRLAKHRGVPLFSGRAAARELFRKYGLATSASLEDLEWLGYEDPLLAGVRGDGPAAYWQAGISGIDLAGYWVPNVREAMAEWRAKRERAANPFYTLKVSAPSERRAIAQGRRFGRVVQLEQTGPETWAVLVDQRRPFRRPNPWDVIRNALRELNPPPPLPVVKKNMHPTIIVGQVGVSAVYMYRGWELELKRSDSGWDVDCLPPFPEHGRPGQYYSCTTFEGALCAGKVSVDFWESYVAFSTREALLFLDMWRQIQSFMRIEMEAHAISPRHVPFPSRARVARKIEVVDEQRRRQHASREPFAWYYGLPLKERLQMIDDVMQLELCVSGPDPRHWIKG